MSIASEITALNTNLQAAKDAVVAKGGTVGDTGLAGLANEIGTISGGGGQEYVAPYGNLTYYKYGYEWEVYGWGYNGDFQIELVNPHLLEEFLEQYPSYSSDSFSIRYVSRNAGGNDTWVYEYNYGTYEFYDDEELYNNTGLYVTWDTLGGQRIEADVQGNKQNTVDTNTLGGVVYLNTEDQFGYLGDMGTFEEHFDFPQDAIASYVAGASLVGFPDYFLTQCSNLKTVDLSRAVNVTAIPNGFISRCVNLDSPIEIPSGVQSIGNDFLSYCYAFNSAITLPSNILSIGNNFMQNSLKFNQPLTLPSRLNSIGDNFLRIQGTGKFNQPLVLPDNLQTIGHYFLASQGNFDQQITLPSRITQIKNYFLQLTGITHAPTLTNNITSIGNSFLGGCTKLNEHVTVPTSVTTIGEGFMSNCSKYASSITIPAGCQISRNSFMYLCNNFTSLEFNGTLASSTTNSNYTLATNSIGYPIYQTGVTVTGSNRAAFLQAFPNRTSNPYRKLIDGGA